MMKVVETVFPIKGVKKLEQLYIKRPIVMPFLDKDEVVICILDCVSRYICVCCETKEDIQELYDKYATNGAVDVIYWYKGKKDGFTILNEGSQNATIYYKPSKKNNIAKTNVNIVNLKFPESNTKILPKEERLIPNDVVALEILKDKRHARNITRKEMLAYLYLNIKDDYDRIKAEKLDNNTLFKMCYLIRRYGDIYTSYLTAIKLNHFSFNEIEDCMRGCSKELGAVQRINVFTLPKIYMGCNNTTSFGYVIEEDKRHQLTKAYYVNGERRREKQYKMAYGKK